MQGCDLLGRHVAPCFSREQGWVWTAGPSENTSSALDGAQGRPQKAVGSKTGPSPGGLRSPDLKKGILETLLCQGAEPGRKAPLTPRGFREGRQRGPVSSAWERAAATTGHEIGGLGAPQLDQRGHKSLGRGCLLPPPGFCVRVAQV